MKYEKPIVIELNARTAAGQDPLACIAGGTVVDHCLTGADNTMCYAGTNGNIYPGQDCYSGITPQVNYGCAAGGAATGFECSAGATPQSTGACTSGPAN